MANNNILLNPTFLHTAIVQRPQVGVKVATASVIQKVATTVETNNSTPPVVKFFPNVIFRPFFITGPIITSSNPTFFDDRFNANKKWFLPNFELSQPLVNSFSFTCFKNGIDKDANPVYNGEVNFILAKKNLPAIDDLIKANPTITYQEIPLNNLVIKFVVLISDNNNNTTPLEYIGAITQQNNNYNVTIKIGQQDGLIRFYKFIANPDNAQYCSLSIAANYFGYTLKQQQQRVIFYRNIVRQVNTNNSPTSPEKLMSTFHSPLMFNRINNVAATSVINNTPTPPPEYDSNNALLFVKIINAINYDCHSFPSNYINKDNGNTFSCHPPFSDTVLSKTTYTSIQLTSGTLAGLGISKIYQNTFNGNYLLIPETYCIMLEKQAGSDSDGILVPSAYLFTSVDANNILNSLATFKFNIAPSITSWQVLQFKKLVLQNLPAGSKTIVDINVEFPFKIHQAENISFASNNNFKTEIVSSGNYDSGVAGSKYFHLEFQNVSIGNADAATLALQLKQSGGNLVKKIVFDVDTDTDLLPESSINLSFDNITGNAIAIIKSTIDNSILFDNNCLYDISLDKLAAPTGDDIILQNSLVDAGNNIISYTPQNLTTDIASLVCHYSFSLNNDYRNLLLKEIRLNDANISDNIIVTNNTGLFTMFNIKQIDFTVFIFKPEETNPVADGHHLFTQTISILKDGAINYIPFLLPVSDYISKWSALYLTSVVFSDDTPVKTNVVQIDDINGIGKIINLTVSNLNLKT